MNGLVRMKGLEPSLPRGNWNLNSLDRLAGGGAPWRINGLRRIGLVRNGVDRRHVCFGFASLVAFPGVIGPSSGPQRQVHRLNKFRPSSQPDLIPKHRVHSWAAMPDTPPARTGWLRIVRQRPVGHGVPTTATASTALSSRVPLCPIRHRRLHRRPRHLLLTGGNIQPG